MLNHLLQRRVPLRISSLGSRLSYNFSLAHSILQYLRMALNKIKWEENREFRALQQRNPNVPKNQEQAKSLFIAQEQERSVAQRGRMERIDQILGTRTFFHETKIYQERLDSDHIMDIQQLKKQNQEPTRETLNWSNPQSPSKVKFKNKRKYYSLISKIRVYPTHQQGIYDFENQQDLQTINFLAKQTLYSKISLKSLELTVQSMENQVTGSSPDKPFSTQRYVYFRPFLSAGLLRIPKNLYSDQILKSQQKQVQMADYIQNIISLDEIYNILKNYDEDQRVNQYIKKIENNRLDYLFSTFTYDKNQNLIAIMIDLLGTSKQYCLIIKNLALEKQKKYSKQVIFNIKPNIIFSSDGNNIYYIQRSEEGGWIQLISRKVQTLLYPQNTILTVDSPQSAELLYRCSPDNELQLGTDSNKEYIFLTLSKYKQSYTEGLFIVDQKKQGDRQILELIEVDNQGSYRYEYDICPLGLIFTRYTLVDKSFLKFGKSQHYSHQVFLVPYKNHIQIFQEQKIGLSQNLLLQKYHQIDKISAKDFDIKGKRVIYRAGQNQFIREMQVRGSHLILVLNLYSLYDKGILYFLPFKPSAHPHSLILGGGTQLKIRKNNYNYKSYDVQFTKQTGIIQTDMIYNIWKKQLKQGCESLNRYHTEKINISSEGYPLQINVICRELFLQEKDAPIVIYFPSRNDEITGQNLRRFLEKGVFVIEFIGRGTFSRDIQHYVLGTKDNLHNQMKDIQKVIQFVGNTFSKNISLYCKGETSSLIGLWLNLVYPYLFNATVLHNGIYDLNDLTVMAQFQDFFGNLEDQKQQAGVLAKWSKYNVFKLKFKRPFTKKFQKNQNQEQDKPEYEIQGEEQQSTEPKSKIESKSVKLQKEFQVGILQNLVFSSDRNHRLHSRRLIYRLRQNPVFNYQQVYLREYENDFEADLNNLSYLYFKIRQRMENDLNDPSLDQEDQEEPQHQKKE